MHLTARFILLLVIMGIATSCGSAQPSPIPVAISSTITAPAPTTAPPIHTPLPSVTPLPTPTVTPEPKCLTIEDQIPADLGLKGAWVREGNKPYIEDVRTGEKKAIPLEGGATSWGDFAVSPDGKWFAYIDDYLKNDRLSRRILRVISSSGYSLDMTYWPGDFQWIGGWTRDGWIILEENIGSIESRKYLILNPFTGEYREIRPTWLDEITSIYPGDLFWLFFNSKMDRVAILEGLKHELRDVYTGKVLDPNLGSEFTWSPEGSILAENSYRSLRLIKDGGGQTFFTPTNEDITDIVWSNNSQNLLAMHSSYFDSMGPEIFDLKTGQFTNICIVNDGFKYRWGDGFWSPDDRFILLNMYRQKGQSDLYYYYSRGEPFDLLIDTQQMRAYRLTTEDWNRRIAWLAKP